MKGAPMWHSIKVKALLVFFIIHVGFAFALYSMFKLWSEGTFPQPHVLYTLTFGTLALYGGMCLGLFFVYLPVAPWIRRANRIKHWKEWIIQELPTLLALVPIIAGLYQIFKAGWKELKTAHHSGALDLQKFSEVTSKVVEQTQSTVNNVPKTNDKTTLKPTTTNTQEELFSRAA